VIANCNDFARVAVCGLILQYNGQQPAAVSALDEFTRLILSCRLNLRGFIVSDFDNQYSDFETGVSECLKSGSLKKRQYIRRVFDQIVPAFLALLSGENIGRTLFRIADSA